jgi:hypothetical protein
MVECEHIVYLGNCYGYPDRVGPIRVTNRGPPTWGDLFEHVRSICPTFTFRDSNRTLKCWIVPAPLHDDPRLAGAALGAYGRCYGLGLPELPDVHLLLDESIHRQLGSGHLCVLYLYLSSPGYNFTNNTAYNEKAKTTTCKIPLYFNTKVADMESVEVSSCGALTYFQPPFHDPYLAYLWDLPGRLPTRGKDLEKPP